MVNQISFPTYQVNSTVDPSSWSTLSNLGNVYREAQDRQTKMDALSRLGADPAANLQALLTSKDPALVQAGLVMQQHLADQKIANEHWTKQFGLQAAQERRAQGTYDEEAKDRETAPGIIRKLFPDATAAPAASPFPAPLPGQPPQAVPVQPAPAPPPNLPQPAAPLNLPPLASLAPPAMRPPIGLGLQPDATPPQQQAEPPPPVTPPSSLSPVMAPPSIAPPPAMPFNTRLDYPASLPAKATQAAASLVSGAPVNISGADLGEMYANTQTRDLAKAIIQKRMDPGSWSYQNVGGKIMALNSNDPRKNYAVIDAPQMDVTTIKAPGQPDKLIRYNKVGPEGPIDTGQPQQADGVDPTTLTGEDYIKTLPKNHQNVVRGVLDLSMDINKLSQQGGYRNAIKDEALQASGGKWNEYTYPLQQKALTEFATGGKNSPAGSLMAGATYVEHLKHISDVSQRLGGPSGYGPLTSPINKGMAAYMKASDNPDLNEYNGILGRAAEEGTTFYRGIGGTEKDVERDIAAMPPGMAQAARDRGIATQASAMYAKLIAFQDRWKNAMGTAAWDRISKEQGWPVISRTNLGYINTMLERGGLQKIPVPENMQPPKSGLGPKADQIIDDARYALTQGVPREVVTSKLKLYNIPASALKEE